MNKTPVVTAIVVALVVVGVGAYWYHSVGGQVPGWNTSTQDVENAASTTGGDGSPIAENLIVGQSGAAGSAFLTAYNGMTLYTFDKDSVGTTTCYGQCAVNWPPYTVVHAGDINIPAGMTGMGTVTRADGALQMTYNDKPLYFYIKDTKPGDKTGDGVGGVWHLAAVGI